MERAEFPVDTHVWHITKKLGWVPASCTRESCYEHLNNRIPDELKFALHVLLVDHGKVCKACSKGGCAKSLDKNHVRHPLLQSSLSRYQEFYNTNPALITIHEAFRVSDYSLHAFLLYL